MHVAQVVVGSAAQHQAAVTLAAPMGERDPKFPLRGRDDLLEILMRVRRERTDGRLQVLHGLGGCGKTALLLELVHHICSGAVNWAPLIWWVDARWAAGLEAGLRAVARHVGLERAQAGGEDVADALWARLNQMRQDWVLIIDDVADPSMLNGAGRLSAGTGWLRPHSCPGGLVLVTTRIGSVRVWGPGASLHAVRPLQVATAGQVLLDHAGTAAGSSQEAQELAERLGGLALALRMAGSYLNEVNAMPKEFREPGMPLNFKAYRQALDGPPREGGHAQAVSQTLRLSLDLLHSQGFPYAERLLQVLAAFADAPIPYTILLRPGALQGVGGVLTGLDGTGLWRTLRELAALSLVDLVEAPTSPAEGPSSGMVSTVRLHPLIRDASRTGMQTDVAVGLMGQAVLLPALNSPEEPRCWPAWQVLAPHALYLLSQAVSGTQLTAAQLTASCDSGELAGRYLQSCGLPHQALEEFRKVLALRERIFGSFDSDTLTSRHNLASCLHDLGELVQALPLYQSVWEARCRSVGDEHASALTARHELGRVLHDQRRLEEARGHLNAVLEARQRLLGDEHSHTLAARHELARVLHDQGDLVRARQEYTQILAVRRRLLGAAHPRTLIVQHNYACVLHDQGDWSEAEAQLREVREARQRILGRQHPQTLSTEYRLCCVLRDRGDAAESRLRLQALWEISQRVLGGGHPLTVKAAETLESFPESP